MRSIKYMTLGLLLAIGMFFAALYVSSCSKDACKGVTCLNHGTCNGGNCTCIDSGTGGLNCEIVYRLQYANSYEGNAVVTYSHFDSLALDSGYIAHTDTTNIISFSIGNDTMDNQMGLTWADGATTMLSLPSVTLQNSTSSGSTFSVPATLGGPGDTFTVSGNGSVSATTASLNLTAVPPHPNITPTIYYTLSNCPKQ